MRIYLASSVSEEHRTKMYEVLESLKSAGHDVYIPDEHKTGCSNSESEREIFENHTNAIKESECVMAFDSGWKTKDDVPWEVGYAQETGKPVIITKLASGPCLPAGISVYDFCKKPKSMTKPEQI